MSVMRVSVRFQRSLRIGVLLAFAGAEPSPAVTAFANHIREILPSI